MFCITFGIWYQQLDSHFRNTIAQLLWTFHIRTLLISRKIFHESVFKPRPHTWHGVCLASYEIHINSQLDTNEIRFLLANTESSIKSWFSIQYNTIPNNVNKNKKNNIKLLKFHPRVCWKHFKIKIRDIECEKITTKKYIKWPIAIYLFHTVELNLDNKNTQ